MKELSALQPFSGELAIAHLAAARLIGRSTRSGGDLGNTAPRLWDSVFASDDAQRLLALPALTHGDLLGWTCEFDPTTNTFVYFVGTLTPAGTKVPDGFEFRDVPETLCALGCYGESVQETAQRAEALGFHPNWEQPGCGWNAEYAFREEEAAPPRPNVTPWHWLVPVRKI